MNVNRIVVSMDGLEWPWEQIRTTEDLAGFLTEQMEFLPAAHQAELDCRSAPLGCPALD